MIRAGTGWEPVAMKIMTLRQDPSSSVLLPSMSNMTSSGADAYCTGRNLGKMYVTVARQRNCCNLSSHQSRRGVSARQAVTRGEGRVEKSGDAATTLRWIAASISGRDGLKEFAAGSRELWKNVTGNVVIECKVVKCRPGRSGAEMMSRASIVPSSQQPSTHRQSARACSDSNHDEMLPRQPGQNINNWHLDIQPRRGTNTANLA